MASDNLTNRKQLLAEEWRDRFAIPSTQFYRLALRLIESDDLRSIMARDPAVQVMVLLAAAKHWNSENLYVGTVAALANAIEKGEVTLTVEES